MKKFKLAAAVTSVAIATATVSLTAAPAEARTVVADIDSNSGDDDTKALPALAVAGLAGAFLIGIAQGYMEEVNKEADAPAPTEEPTKEMANMSRSLEFDYVLN